MNQPEELGGPWHGTAPDLIVAAVAVAATGAAVWAMAGWPGLAVTATATAAIALVVIRTFLPRATADSARQAIEKRTARPVTGYSHRRFVVSSGLRNRAFYDIELRPLLEHLLAARLAERHGINLYTSPEAARRLLCRHRRDAVLWQWIAPESAGTRTAKRGIPAYILARLVDRLEKL